MGCPFLVSSFDFRRTLFSDVLKIKERQLMIGVSEVFCLSLLSRVVPPLKACPRDSFDEAVVSRRLLCVGASS